MNKKHIISTSDDIALKLKVLAREKESVRRKLAVTAEKLRLKAKELASIAREKERVRQKLVVTASKLKGSYETLEKKVFDRTSDLEDAKVKNEAILSSIGDGLAVVDKGGNIIYINGSFEEMLGWKAEEVIGKSMGDVVPREDLNGVRELFNERILTQVLSGKKFVRDMTNPFYFIRKDKSRFPVSIIISPVVLDGKIIGAVEAFRDITREKNIDKVKIEFVYLASHQLRTPLTTISWYTEMILKGDVGQVSVDQKKYLEQIYNGDRRMIELVNTLLDASRIEMGTFKTELKSTDILALAKGVIEEHRLNIDKKKLIVVEDFDTDMPLFMADEKLLGMIFDNLLANAVEYTPEGGRIEFSISEEDKKTVQIKISDTGYGIPKKQQDQIFTRLFRADNVRDKDTEGTGLGLYIVKSVVENMGGKIWFESEENKGTTFYVSLPLKEIKNKGHTK